MVGFVAFTRLPNGSLVVHDIIECSPQRAAEFWRYMVREFNNGLVDEVRVFTPPHSADPKARVVLKR